MADNSRVNPQIVDSINQVQLATMSPQVVLTSGAGKAYQSVAQSTAIAVQDATDALRNISTIVTTAVGVALAEFMVTGNTQYIQVVEKAQDIMQNAAEDYGKIGTTAASVLKSFPSG